MLFLNPLQFFKLQDRIICKSHSHVYVEATHYTRSKSNQIFNHKNGCKLSRNQPHSTSPNFCQQARKSLACRYKEVVQFLAIYFWAMWPFGNISVQFEYQATCDTLNSHYMG